MKEEENRSVQSQEILINSPHLGELFKSKHFLFWPPHICLHVS